MKLQVRTDKVHKVRNDHFVPGVLYGKKIEAMSVQAEELELKKIFKENGKTQVFKTKLDGKTHQVYIKDVQVDPLRPGNIIHFDLIKVTGKDTITANIPVIIHGKDAVEKKRLLVSVVLSEIPCEYLVGKGITKFELDVTELNMGDAIYIKDLESPDDVKILAHLEDMVLVIREGAMKAEVEEVEEIEAIDEEIEEIEEEKEKE